MAGPWPLAPHHDHLQHIHHVHLMQWGQNRGVTEHGHEQSTMNLCQTSLYPPINIIWIYELLCIDFICNKYKIVFSLQ